MTASEALTIDRLISACAEERLPFLQILQAIQRGLGRVSQRSRLALWWRSAEAVPFAPDGICRKRVSFGDAPALIPPNPSAPTCALAVICIGTRGRFSNRPLSLRSSAKLLLPRPENWACSSANILSFALLSHIPGLGGCSLASTETMTRTSPRLFPSVKLIGALQLGYGRRRPRPPIPAILIG